MRRNLTSAPMPPSCAAPAVERPGHASDYGPVELAAALHGAVARIGAGGPQAAGLIRIRHVARTRRYRRTVMTGGLGALLAAMTVTVSAAVGNRAHRRPRA
ncbi:hypothetical protein KDL01_15420 [Actinospica durhamensis]|uniref:Uncharacterized protein n=1 Tax=Actinospica durhamensis TaxID=1508375 RepID=A0A941EQI1_9ACTN|nr:hypothetical protein [Actinospica durhamensis]MBR7834663.1 hypothetical protein [Actinospica durhamensis]